MIHLLGHLLKLPVSMFVSGMEILFRSMQDAQKNFEKGVDDVVRELVGDARANPDGARLSPIEAEVAQEDPGRQDTIQPFRLEEPTMYENDDCQPDLSGDDVKTVGYWITFQKPDFETTLQERRDETIDYSTTAESFAGLKLMDFIKKLERDGIPYPSEWNVKPDKDYKIVWRRIREGTKLKSRRFLKGIPKRDHRYIDVQVVLSFRRPRQDARYDKQKVDILRQIRDELRDNL
jgi:hypothetical protein